MRERNKTLAISASLRQRSVDAGGGSGSSMTLAKLRAIVAEAEGPSTPLAITRLALNCQLLMDVGPDIGAFAEVQQLLLNQNKIRRIQHLGALQQLRCLYLQHNLISQIEGLSELRSLRILDLSHNSIEVLDGLADIPLESLIIASNRLSSVESLAHLLKCNHLSELDVGYNQISDPAVLCIFRDMTCLQTLTLHYNPVSNAADPHNTRPAVLPNYRRTVICMCGMLTALDHKPVFPQERKYAESWWADSAAHADTGSPALSPTGALDRHPQRLLCAAVSSGVAQAGDAPAAGEASNSAGVRGLAHCDENKGGAQSIMPGSSLPPALLHPVMDHLDVRSLTMAAMACRWWARLASERLWEQRLRTAQERLAASEASWQGACTALRAIKREDLASLPSLVSPPVPLVQLFWALRLVWQSRKLLPGADAARHAVLPGCVDASATSTPNFMVHAELAGMAHATSCSGEDGGVEAEAAWLVGASRGRAASSEAAFTAGAASDMLPSRGQERAPLQEAPCDGSVPAGSACSTPGASSAPATGAATGTALERATSAGASSVPSPGETFQPEELHQHYDSSTWVAQSWEECVAVLHDPRFPHGLADALPMSSADVRRLRARTGAADDLEVYTPELTEQEVGFRCRECIPLAHWLLAMQEHEHARIGLEQAQVWEWPQQMQMRMSMNGSIHR